MNRGPKFDFFAAVAAAAAAFGPNENAISFEQLYEAILYAESQNKTTAAIPSTTLPTYTEEKKRRIDAKFE